MMALVPKAHSFPCTMHCTCHAFLRLCKTMKTPARARRPFPCEPFSLVDSGKEVSPGWLLQKHVAVIPLGVEAWQDKVT